MFYITSAVLTQKDCVTFTVPGQLKQHTWVNTDPGMLLLFVTMVDISPKMP